MLEIPLHRHRVKETTCDGTISISGGSVCDTTEHARHRLSAGTYHICLCRNKTFGRRVPTIKEQPTICIVPGNGIWNATDGRIIVGHTICPGCVKLSRPLFILLYGRINAALRRGHEVLLRVTE
ncbi:MAG: DUF5675 family protein [Bacteroidaceae bacterium]|nr:DUF5675 family protein [Bacteroidaceae bacterium]